MITEGLVIVTSILLAFGLDSLWDYRNDRREEAEVLHSLAEEFRTNRAILEQTIGSVEQDQSRIDVLVSMTPAEAGALPGDTAWGYLNAVWKPNTNELASGALTSALASGRLALVRDDAVRALVGGWPGRVDDLRERQGVMIRQEANVQAAVDRIAAEQGIARLGPETAPYILRGLRADAQAMATVARKHFQARIYVMALRSAVGMLDSTVAALPPL